MSAITDHILDRQGFQTFIQSIASDQNHYRGHDCVFSTVENSLFSLQFMVNSECFDKALFSKALQTHEALLRLKDHVRQKHDQVDSPRIGQVTVISKDWFSSAVRKLSNWDCFAKICYGLVINDLGVPAKVFKYTFNEADIGILCDRLCSFDTEVGQLYRNYVLAEKNLVEACKSGVTSSL